MVKTITLGSHILVQGTWVRDLSCGRMVVRVGQLEYIGQPVRKAA